MHVVFFAPETNVYNRRFVDALKRKGAFVTGIGHAAEEKLAPELARQLDRYERVGSLFDDAEVLAVARRIETERAIERVETIDEPAIGPAARLRETLEIPGLHLEQAKLCRDKAAMKDAWRAAGIPCAASCPATTRADAVLFAEHEGFPLVVKPREGFGTLNTFRVTSQDELARALDTLGPSETNAIVVEEFVEGHEGFYDTITAGGKIAHAFIGHYYPTCLEALQDRRIRPKIACTNRVDVGGYAELHDAAARVIQSLGLVDTATHMEWFFGPKGLKISEIGARPAGERIWDMHAAGNEFDLYGAWSDAVLTGRAAGTPTRRFATGSVQIRPDRDGRYAGHNGVEAVHKALGADVLECEIPKPGSPTQPLAAGWHANTWFRVRDTDYDRLREKLEFIANTVQVRVS